MSLDDIHLDFELVYSTSTTEVCHQTTETQPVGDPFKAPRAAPLNKAKKDDFEVLKHIGSGAFGKVRSHFSVFHHHTGSF
jgi:hypothetical protein